MRVGEKQTIETLINEDVLLFAKFLKKQKIWIPGITMKSEKVLDLSPPLPLRQS